MNTEHHDKSVGKSHIKKLRELLNMPRDFTHYDTNLNINERRVLLSAAGLPRDTYHLNKKFSDWSGMDQLKIKTAAKRASDWAKNLGVAL